MTRTHASALLLVNWRGVFYERYQLDRHVTALEGANGAGKTTVMIAAYVALFPDLSRLRFVNLGETGATGGDRGIFGRLGHPGPAYCGLELSLGGGRRALAGVYLERKAEPSIALKPFLVEGLAEDPPEPFLLARGSEQESVPPFSELPARARQLGVRFRAFNSAKEYFSALFELGATPLRLSTEEERNKLGEMLRTSMTGGISRTLTSDLRSFLFKEQSGLMDTLSRMRRNLDACRRTRLEVAEARGLEGELHAVYQRGQAMFEQALCATAAGYEAACSAERSASSSSAQAAAGAREATTRVQQLNEQNQRAVAQLEQGRSAAQAAQALLSRLQQAHALAKELHRLEQQHGDSAARAEQAERAHEAAVTARSGARVARDAARNDLQRAAAGLANLEAGLEELHRRSHAHHRARQSQGALEAALGAGSAAKENLADSARAIEEKLRQLDTTWATRDRTARLQERYQASREATRNALRQVSEVRACLVAGAPLPRDTPGEPRDDNLASAARRSLEQMRQWELSALQASALQQQLDRARARRHSETELRASLSAWGLESARSSGELFESVAALEAAEQAARTACDRHQTEQKQAEASEQAARDQQTKLRAQAEICQRRRALQARLRLAPTESIETEAQLQQTLERAYAEQATLRAQLERCREQVQALEQQATQVSSGGAEPDAELAELAEALGGQVLAERYESLEPTEARQVEAELGPLVDAIVVPDAKAAAAAARTLARTRESLWLLDSEAALSLEPADRTWLEGAQPAQTNGVQEVVVPFQHGLRVTRLPQDARLGARARAARRRRLEHQIAALRKGEQEQELALEAARERIEVLRKLQPLWTTPPLVAPERMLSECQAELTTQRQRQRAAQESGCEAQREADRLQARLTALRALLPEAHLLDTGPETLDPEALAASLAQAHGQARALRELACAKSTLERELPTLSDPSCAAQAQESLTWQQQKQALGAERERWFQLSQAASDLREQLQALAWADAPAALEREQELVPELAQQHARAQKALQEAEEECERKDAEWEAASEARQRQRALVAGLEAECERARRQLAAVEAPVAPTAAALDSARAAAASATDEAAERERRERELSAELALAQHEKVQAERAALDAAQQAEVAGAALVPLEEQRERLHQRVEALGLELPAPTSSAQGSQELWALAGGASQRLLDQLQRTRGARPLCDLVSERLGARDNLQDARPFVECWQAVRGWLLERLPRPLATLEDPLQGLLRLRTDLERLEQRLSHQEQELKGASSDVARTIDVQIRRASSRVRRLNQHLAGLSFGSVHAIRVHVSRAQRMQQVLEALREGETQALLFQTQLPIEEAFGEIFRRYGGGKGGGRRLVDFREYLELAVEIQRRGSDEWQRVNPSRVSTGEAIGVGAALMMVTLAEWEREGSLLRGKREAGSLRFLFLDEANRLSQDNLGALFELCRSLDLQLLIAAPEVAKAHGNTTYRLVRRLRPDGEEEVVACGRRTRSAPVDPPSPQQQSLIGPPQP